MQFALYATLFRPRAMDIVRDLVDWLAEHGQGVRLSPLLATLLDRAEFRVPEEHVIEGADIAIAVGGDGTMLGAVRAAAPFGVPVLGVNAGALGFLTELAPEELPEYLPRLLAKDYTLKARLMLHASIFRGEEWLDGSLALNDIVVRQGSKGRLINLDVVVAGCQLGYFSADGLILSTPTGSTAYGLSAGGPIIHPDTSVMNLVPICPHSLSFRPMVIPSDDPVEIRCEGNQHGDEMMVSADGQDPVIVITGDRIVVHAARECALLVKFGAVSFYDRLREKLQWGAR